MVLEWLTYSVNTGDTFEIPAISSYHQPLGGFTKRIRTLCTRTLYHIRPSFLLVQTQKSPTKIFYSTNDESPIPKNKLETFTSSQDQFEKGLIYDKKPFKVTLKADKPYMWCACGQSKSQPFCDGTHKNQFLKITMKPVRFKVDNEKEYYLCNCKQTSKRPFCDGTHKREDIQAKK